MTYETPAPWPSSAEEWKRALAPKSKDSDGILLACVYFGICALVIVCIVMAPEFHR